MSTNADVITALEANKAVLQRQVGTGSLTTSNKLMLAIHALSDEIGALEAAGLAGADYLPKTDAFKKVTEDGKSFVNSLNDLKDAFSKIGAVAGAIDQVLKLVTTFGL